MPKECDIQDFQMSGNTASYKMACTGAHKMNADTKMTFGGDGYTMDMKMQSNESGHPMNMSQHIVATYKGACTAGAPTKK